MISSDVELPSNKKFGIFLSFLFVVIAGFFLYKKIDHYAYICLIIAFILLLSSLLRADLLHPLNKLWMKFGLLLGSIVNPILLGLIFIIIFSPIALLMRLMGRDELHLKFERKKTYWIKRSDSIDTESFKNQF